MPASVDDGVLRVPVRLKGITYYRNPTGSIYCHVRVRPVVNPTEPRVAYMWIYDAEGAPCARIEELRFQTVDREALMSTEAAGGEKWVYELKWQQEPPSAGPTAAVASQSWLVLAESTSAAEPFAVALQARGHRCAVEVWSEFHSADEGEAARTWQRTKERYAGLMQGGSHWDAILYLGAMPAGAPPAPADTERDATAEWANLFCLAQSLDRAPSTPRLCVVSAATQQVQSADRVPNVASATIWGIGKTLRLEYPSLRCLNVDCDGPKAAPSVIAAVEQGGSEDTYAIRDGVRFIPRLTRAAAEQNPDLRRADFSAEKTYLVVGGQGGIGLAVARWLVDKGAKHLVLVGRRAESEDLQARRAAWAGQGATVRYLPADVAKRDEVFELVRRIEQDGPPLGGVIHAAGVIDDAILSHQDYPRVMRVLGPKMQGAWNLHLATVGKPLDCFLLFSSIASLFGSPGQTNYSAANAFLDSLAQHRRAQGLAGTSVNWGIWATAGMAVDEPLRKRFAARGLSYMQPDACFGILDGRWPRMPAQFAVLDVDWARLGQEMPTPLLAELVEAPAKAEANYGERLDASKMSAAELKEAIEQQVRMTLKLGPKDALDPNLSFSEFGMDSLMATEFRARLQAVFGYTLDSTVIFSYPTLTLLTNHLADKIGGGAATATAVVPAQPQDKDDELASLLAEVSGLSDDAAAGKLGGEPVAVAGAGAPGANAAP